MLLLMLLVVRKKQYWMSLWIAIKRNWLSLKKIDVQLEESLLKQLKVRFVVQDSVKSPTIKC